MFPIFLWVREYNCLKNFSVILDNDYDIVLEVEDTKINKPKPKTGRRPLGTPSFIKEEVQGFSLMNLKIKKKDSNKDENRFYGENIDNIKAIVGKNGTGKTSLLEIMSIFTEGNRTINQKKPDFKEVEFLIIYKTNKFDSEGKEIFMLEGYSPFEMENFFRFLTNIPERTYIKDYFAFEMNIDNKFIELKDNISEFGVVRLSQNISTSKGQIKSIDKESRDKKNRIYKLNLNFRHVSKSKVFEYIKSNKQSENYLDFYFLITILKKTYHYDLIESIYDNFSEDNIINEKIYLNILDENNSIKNVILNQFYNNLYQYEIFKKIKKLNTIEEIDQVIDSQYNLYTKNTHKEKIADELLKVIDLVENTNLLKEKILNLSNTLQTLQDKKIIKCIDLFKYKIDLEHILLKKNQDSIINFLNCYDELITYEWGNNLFTDEITQTLRIEEKGMSDGEKVRLNQFTTLFRVLNGEFVEKKYITILIDEAETFLHPEWCRTLLNAYLKELTINYPDKEFKLIFVTHSPFILSDLLSKDIIYLKKINDEILIENNSNIKTFGGNIHNLLKKNMFMESTFGEFSKTKIQEFIKNIEEAKNYNEINILSQNILLEETGEPLIRERLKIMIDEKLKKMEDKSYYQSKILEYEMKIKEYKKKLEQKDCEY